MRLGDKKSQLLTWMGYMSQQNNDPQEYLYVDESLKTVHLMFYTADTTYHITTGESNELKCVAMTRRPCAGETWLRRVELFKGIFGEQTWLRILSEIVGWEMVKTCRSVKYWLEDNKIIFVREPGVVVVTYDLIAKKWGFIPAKKIFGEKQ